MSYHENVIVAAQQNAYFRRVLATGKHSQVVVMALQPGEDIGMEVHDVDQILVFVVGTGQATLNGQASDLAPGDLVYVPAGTQHNFTNTGSTVMKLYTVYAPPEHADGTIHRTKADAAAAHHDEEKG